MKKSCPKVAIYYDWINQWGGAEQVLLDILKIFPQAEILTLFYKKQTWLPKNIKIITPPFSLKKYDLVISTTSYFGYLINADVYYFHNINRYLFNTPIKYLDRLLIKKNKIYLCNSKNVQKRIKQHLNLAATVVYPGIDTNKFIPIQNPTLDYFLCVSRLVPYKNIDKALLSCQKLKQKLLVVGTGRQEKYLKSLVSSKYITFTGKVSPDKILSYYQNCKALICPQIEDFGLAALESQSCGRPVIALAKGGNLETVNPKTGLLYQKNLTQAIHSFNPNDFDPKICRQHALRFSKTKFMLNFKNACSKKIII